MAREATRDIPFVDLAAQYAAEREALLPRLDAVLASGYLIGGPEVEALESELAFYCGTRHAVSVNSGTDALTLGMEALGLGPGDEVITPPNSFISSTSSIVRVGATPVFADVLMDELIDPAAVEAAITPRTAAIMPVHLRGGVAQMGKLQEIARRHGLLLIEDAAQAVGSAENGVRTGALGDLGCFSAHPLKLLNAGGDAGFVTTNSDEVAGKLKRLRNAGLETRDRATDWGTVSRLDALQAALLRFRLDRLDDVISARRANAAHYIEKLEGREFLLPKARSEEFHTYNTFTLKTKERDALMPFLLSVGVDVKVHYAVPLHLQPVAQTLGYREGDFPITEQLSRTILSLPVHQFLSSEDLDYVVDKMTEFDGMPELSVASR